MGATASPAVRLRADAWSERMGHLHLGRVEEQAEFVGVSRAQLYRVLARDVAPGEQFIAAALAATGAKFEELFEIAGAS